MITKFITSLLKFPTVFQQIMIQNYRVRYVICTLDSFKCYTFCAVLVLHFLYWCYTWTALLSANQNQEPESSNAFMYIIKGVIPWQ